MRMHSLYVFSIGLWLAASSSPALSTDLSNANAVNENNTALCRKEATKRGVLDAPLFNFCMHKQKEGVAELKAQIAQHGSLPWFPAALRHFTNYWTKQGLTDYRMVPSEMGHAIDGYLDVQYKLKNKEVTTDAFERCRQQWTKDYVDWGMINFCLKDS